MHDANLERDWRRVSRADGAKRKIKITFRNVTGVADGEIELTSFATAFVGGNGTGKSTLLSIVRVALDQELLVLPEELQSRFLGASMSCEVTEGEKAALVECDILQDCSIERRINAGTWAAFTPSPVHFFDLAGYARYLKLIFSSSERRDSLLEGVDEDPLKQKEISQLNWVSRKEYTAIHICEVQAPSDDPHAKQDDTIPYFTASEEGSDESYGLETMGSGELCLLLAFWFLSRSDPRSIILIDEPESSLPPWGQSVTARQFATLARARGSMFAIATHSDFFIQRMPLSWLRLAYRVDGTTQILPFPSRDRVNMSLDLLARADVYLLCEDRVADKFLDAILHETTERNWPNAEIIRVGSESAITAIIDHAPMHRSLRLVGVYDGDRGENVRPAPHAHKLYLPGGVSPEEYIQGLIKANKDQFAAAINIDRDRLDVTLASITGAERHSWLRDLSARLPRNEEEIIRVAVRLMPADETAAFSEALNLAVNFDRDVEALEAIRSLHVNDRPDASEIESVVSDIEQALANPKLALGSKSRERGRAVLAAFQP